MLLYVLFRVKLVPVEKVFSIYCAEEIIYAFSNSSTNIIYLLLSSRFTTRLYVFLFSTVNFMVATRFFNLLIRRIYSWTHWRLMLLFPISICFFIYFPIVAPNKTVCTNHHFVYSIISKTKLLSGEGNLEIFCGRSIFYFVVKQPYVYCQLNITS